MLETEELTLPDILNIPDKLIPIIDDFNDYRYFLIEGGRGGGKTQAVARFILYLSELKSLRVVCGRETQNSISESVYSVLADLISKKELYFDVMASKVIHKGTGTDINFRGFREQGRFNIQGMEGVDIAWIDEAQAITKPTLDSLIPTIRKNNAKIFFTMNRFVRNDPVYEFLIGRDDCLHITINYDENPFCTEALKKEAEACKLKNIEDYNHIWLGKPVKQPIDFLFNIDKLDKSKIIPSVFAGLAIADSIMGVDVAGAGGDLCVASLIERKDPSRWLLVDQREWSEKDTDKTIGKIIALRNEWKPTAITIDKGGLGYPMYCTLQKTIKDIVGFDGAEGADRANAGNRRADGYLTMKDFIDEEKLVIGKWEETIKELENIKRDYRANGLVYIQAKAEMRKVNLRSPDHADSLMMAIWTISNGLNGIIRRKDKDSGASEQNRQSETEYDVMNR